MTMSWDIDRLRVPELGLQRSGGRLAKSICGPAATVVLIATALACNEAAPTLLPPVHASRPAIAVCPVQRASPLAGRPARGHAVGATEFSPDATEGLSSGRLAGIFSSLFEPMDEAEVDVDYSFG
jgi:hypothetical protein